MGNISDVFSTEFVGSF